MKLYSFKREFSGSQEQLLDTFFQVILHEFNSYLFEEKDWKEFTLAYGKLWYSFDLLWIDQLKPFEGKTKLELSQILQKPKNQGFQESFNVACESVSSFLSVVPYNINEGYIDFVDFNSFVSDDDINEPIAAIFSSIKGSFDVIEHDPGVWAFNSIDLGHHLDAFKKQFDELFTGFLASYRITYLTSFILYSEDNVLELSQKVSGEKEAITKEMLLQPGILTWPVDRIMFLIDLKYQKMDGSPLNSESIRRAVNRLKNTILS